MRERGDRGAGCGSGGGPWRYRQQKGGRVGRLNAGCAGDGGEGESTEKNDNDRACQKGNKKHVGEIETYGGDDAHRRSGMAKRRRGGRRTGRRCSTGVGEGPFEGGHDAWSGFGGGCYGGGGRRETGGGGGRGGASVSVHGWELDDVG
jgi:hypothetical protein